MTKSKFYSLASTLTSPILSFGPYFFKTCSEWYLNQKSARVLKNIGLP